MNFGLGLVLSFTDNATAGINNAVNSLDRLTQVAEGATNSLNEMASLSALSVVADKMGSSLLSAGGKILGTFSNIVTGVQQTGTEFQSLRITLNALLKDEEKAENSLKKLMNFAATTPFEINDLTGIFTTITANGLDAFQTLTGATTGFQSSLIGAIGDLMAFRPDVPAERWGVAIRNAFSGEVRSLKNALDLNVNDMLGRKWGSSGDIAQDFMDLADAIGVAGMMSNNFENNMNVQMANMSDIITKIKLAIADTGVFNILVQSIGNISKALQRIDGDRLDKLANSVGSAVQFILKPIIKLSEILGNLIDKVVDFIGTHKGLTKILSVFVSLVGVALILGGILLKLTSAFSGLSLMLIASGKSFKSISKLFTSGIKTLMKKMLPLIALFALIRFAWKNDLAGIRTMTTKFVSNLSSSFKTANKAVNGSVDDLISTMNDLNGKDDFFSNLTRGIIKVQMTMKALSDAWGDYTLSEENFKKAEELGILPLIESILDLKYRFGFFKQGFLDGWSEIGEKVKTAISGIVKSAEGTFLEDAVTNMTSFFDKLASGDTQAWYDFGKSFADFTADALTFYLILKGITMLHSGLTAVAKVLQVMSKLKLTSVLGGFGKEIKNIGMVLNGKQGVSAISKFVEAMRGVDSLKSGKNVMNISNALKTVFGTASTIVSGITLLITGVVTAVVGFVKQLTDGFNWFWEIIKWIGIAIGVVGAIILGVAVWPAVIVGAIIGLLTTIVVLVKQYWTEICDFFKMLGNWIYEKVIKPVADFFVGLWNGIVAGVKAIGAFFATIGTWIYNNVIMPIVNFFMTYIFPIIAKIVEIVMKIIEIVVTLVRVFVQWIYNNVIQPIINFFVGLWNAIVEKVTAFVDKVKEILGIIGSWIYENIISPVAEFFTNLWNGIVEKVTAFVEKVKEIFGAITGWIKENIIDPVANFFKGLWEDIKTAFNIVADTVSGVLKGAINTVLKFICNVINGVIKSINWAIDVINAIPGVSITKIELLELPKLAQGGIVDRPTTALIGEAGTEAVMPLENNLGWIGKLATMITSEMHSIVPTNTSQPISTTNQGDTNQNYMTRNTTNNHTIQGSTDNSVTFSEGAIQVFVQNATEEEARRLARKVMEYIKRQRQLDQMMNYG